MIEQRSVSVVRGLLSLIHAMGGKLEHRIRLQKAVYFLQRSGVKDFRATAFKYYHYGPYSRAVSDAIQLAIASGLLREETSERHATDVSSYMYTLTEEGRAWVLENMDAQDFQTIRERAERFGSEHWRVLELAATTLFLERDEHIAKRDDALRRAIELKPACESYRAPAIRLLQELAL